MKTLTVAVLLVAAWVAQGAASAVRCDMKELARSEGKREGDLPSVALRDTVFVCAGMEPFLPETYDQLDKDLLFLRARHYALDEFASRYPGLPAARLKKLWEYVQELKAAQREPQPTP
ncbi:hypothetical protein M1B72_10950 [Geomonas paludis]|uniref:Lipoprotein n=1 Tax=Geomonas paludis TaxID=2740185 RepID=A0A6V8MSZ7_9BACT|nr:hypothetical protein [Geomonas paludis]UPU38200.1 hypothetical protein M1B72_10950 [Geomonas paludis]GFO63268.1 hypothetical protein GMPD_11870 [Geomonas paludis]